MCFSLLSRMSCVCSGQGENGGSPPSMTQKLSFSILLKLSFESLCLQLEVASSVTLIHPLTIFVSFPPPPQKKKWHARALVLTSRASRNFTFILASSLNQPPGTLHY